MPNQASFTAGTTVAKVTAETFYSKIIIQNRGTIDVALGVTDALTPSTGILLSPGDTFVAEGWPLGEWRAVTASGTCALAVVTI